MALGAGGSEGRCDRNEGGLSSALQGLDKSRASAGEVWGRQRWGLLAPLTSVPAPPKPPDLRQPCGGAGGPRMAG